MEDRSLGCALSVRGQVTRGSGSREARVVSWQPRQGYVVAQGEVKVAGTSVGHELDPRGIDVGLGVAFHGTDVGLGGKAGNEREVKVATSNVGKGANQPKRVGHVNLFNEGAWWL